MQIKKFEDIKAWQSAKELAIDIYKLACKTSYGIDISFKDQIQRACVSIMSNIAEGFEKSTNKNFIKFLYIAKGSAAEVRSLLHLASEIGYITSSEFSCLINKIIEISKMLSGLIKYLANS